MTNMVIESAAVMERQYLNYLKQLYTLSRLDMTVIVPDGKRIAEFTHTVQNVSMAGRRARARLDFLQKRCREYSETGKWKESEFPERSGSYYFFGLTLTADNAFLVLGPFYVNEDVDAILESGLPHYNIDDLPAVRSLFLQNEGPSRTGKENAGDEIHEIETAQTNDGNLITSNARYEQLIRTAVRSGDMKLLKETLEGGHFADDGHYDTKRGGLRNTKNLLLVSNTLACRAAEDGGASSTYVRSVCADMAAKIEKSTSVMELQPLVREIPALYCRIVADSRLKDHSPLIRDCIQWMQDHLTENITLSEAAKHCCVSYEYLSRRVSAECHESYQHLLHSMRCRRAELYLEAGASIGDTALKTGYSSASVFCKAFHRLYGCTPGQWQKEHIHRA